MSKTSDLDINKVLEEISAAVMQAVSYKVYPADMLDQNMKTINNIISTPEYLKQCEDHLRSAGSNYVLFFLSNIIYNLKNQGELVLTPDVLKWLGSVWSNFLQRNKSYQEMFPLFDEYRGKLKKYYPDAGKFIHQIENVNLVKEEFINLDDSEDPENPLRKLEKFYLSASELMNTMRPSYFFLLDYYYEKKLNTGIDVEEAVALETNGLLEFGEENYTYGDILYLSCEALGILEAVYLFLKKKKALRRIVVVDGKQKFLTVQEIYEVYFKKFTAIKKEITNLNK